MSDPWLAAEWLVSPDPERRRQGLAALTAGDDSLASPLVAYLLAARVVEPDLELRAEVVSALARCYLSGDRASAVLKASRDYLSSQLAAFDRAQVERMLEVFEDAPGAVAALLDRIPDLSSVLTRIAADRNAPARTRSAAVTALGDLGVLDALPALEGLKTRIEGQAAGQLAMAFAPPADPNDGKLLQVLEGAIHELKDND